MILRFISRQENGFSHSQILVFKCNQNYGVVKGLGALEMYIKRLYSTPCANRLFPIAKSRFADIFCVYSAVSETVRHRDLWLFTLFGTMSNKLCEHKFARFVGFRYIL